MLKKIFLVLASILLITAAPALAADVIPANCVVNPVNGALYTVDNSTPQIKVYTLRADDTWSTTASDTLALPAGSKCYGLAVNSTGDRLYMSINHGATSDVRYYRLNADGNISDSFTSLP